MKETYFYLDSTPTHSYMKALYKYPQRAFPYSTLVEENGRRSRRDKLGRSARPWGDSVIQECAEDQEEPAAG